MSLAPAVTAPDEIALDEFDDGRVFLADRGDRALVSFGSIADLAHFGELHVDDGLACERAIVIDAAEQAGDVVGEYDDGPDLIPGHEFGFNDGLDIVGGDHGHGEDAAGDGDGGGVTSASEIFGHQPCDLRVDRREINVDKLG